MLLRCGSIVRQGQSAETESSLPSRLMSRLLSSFLALGLALTLTACDAVAPQPNLALADASSATVSVNVAPGSTLCTYSFYHATASVSNLPAGVTVSHYRWYKDGQLMSGETERRVFGTTGAAGSFTHSVYAVLSNGSESGTNVTVNVVSSPSCSGGW